MQMFVARSELELSSAFLTDYMLLWQCQVSYYKIYDIGLNQKDSMILSIVV